MEATAVAAAGFSSREHIEMEEKCGKYPSESQGRSRFNYKKKKKKKDSRFRLLLTGRIQSSPR